jgi:hypothetical protein
MMRYIPVLITSFSCLMSVPVCAQNATVQWSALSEGFALLQPTGNQSLAISAGQPFVGMSSGAGKVLESGFLVHSRLRGILVSVPEQDELPTEFRLEQNYPNPFNPNTRIVYGIPSREFVELRVFDVLGREVATLVNEMKTPGEYAVDWDTRGLASGVFFYRLQAGRYVNAKKMTLVR